MSPKKITVHVDMDDVLCDFEHSFQRDKARYPNIPFPQSRPGFFLELPPIPGAIEGFHYLLAHPGFETYILTAPSVKNSHSYSEKRIWIEKHLGIEATYKLIISPAKHLTKGDYLIDDYESGKGQEEFEGKLIHFGSDEFPDWPSIIQYFKKIAA